MIVDNGVIGDSRVQKQASSIAELGWKVTLLGVSRSQEKKWSIGQARVRLIKIRRHSRVSSRSLKWRDPLAHATISIARYVESDRRARLEIHKSHQAGRSSRSWGSRLTSVRLRLVADLAQFRLSRTENASTKKSEASSWVDRSAATFRRRIHGERSWRWLDPWLLDLELGLGPELDQMKPDIIHANDFRALGIAVRAKWRAAGRGRDVKVVWDAHEYLPGIHPWSRNPQWHGAQIAHEREYAPYADGVVTVSAELAEMLQHDHALPIPPTVVMNCPIATHPVKSSRSLREDCGLGPETPVMAYSGSAREARGLDIMIEALPALPTVVCAVVVADPRSDYVEQLRAKARHLGVLDRFRAVPYVAPEEVVDYLAEANVGVIPIHHYINHEIALITKFFEYAHARLPILVSDVKAMSEEVRRTGVGEVFEAKDLASYVSAAKKILEHPDRYHRAYSADLLAAWTWEEQADRLSDLYDSLL